MWSKMRQSLNNWFFKDQKEIEINGVSEFRNDLETLQNLQRKMISILSCNESQIIISNQITELFKIFEEITISQHFSLYEAFLQIFVHLSIYFNIQETKDEESISKRQEIFFTILKELILKHSLKTSVHQSTLFFIFKSNKHFLLFLFEEGILDISFLISKISSLSDKSIFLFFIPEIQKLKPIVYENLKKRFKLTDKIIKNFYQPSKEKYHEESSQIRRIIHSEEMIAKIIRTDDIHHFIDYISTVENFDLNCKIKPSFLENNPDINNELEGIGLVEYSMIFDSNNIFRYLLLNKVKYYPNSFQYCIIGNNYEILHIFEEESKFEFDFTIMYKSIEYYHPEIIEYFSNSKIFNEKNEFTLSSIIRIFNETTNVEFLFEFLFNNKISELSQNEENRYFSSPKRFISSYNINVIFFDILKSQQYSFYFLYCFLLQQPNLDINTKNNILLLQFIITSCF
ncbi:hypothetical protein TRFO_18700 [Tritrichomonas foetus]|uniref:DUF3447 domain-containing protein n=1 Tax=Tritrichomonas foetus TaxID=1144522 RepID=A0A1J4KKP1_9EUKA|nr:hypothetical protein TRFO_18700 [Tritrichomonas foetus]|eukprot:OHT11795.1 hypothetical protein TRFO_18700 [Tritrichomonas foetus]